MVSETEFIKAIQENERIIHKVCNIYMQTKADREDLYQEIVLNAWKGIRNFREESKFSTWLYRVALNTAITIFKKDIKHAEVIDVHPAVFSNEPADNENEEYNAMISALKELTDIEKALIMLYFEDYSYQEIAAIAGITANNVAVKMNRIKTKLKESTKKFL